MEAMPEMEFTGGGWKLADESSKNQRSKIIDSHYHIFPRIGSQKGGVDPALRLRFWQFHLRDWLTFFRKKDGQRIERRLLEFGSNNISDMPDLDFHLTDFGQAEFTLDAEDYIIQFCPPSLTNMEAPPQRMVGEMNLAGVDVGVIQTDHVYGDLTEYVAQAMKQFPGRFIGLVQVWEPEGDQRGQIERLERAVLDYGMKGLYFSVEPFTIVQLPARLDDSKFDPLWQRVRELQIPVFWFIDDRAADRAGKFLERLVELDHWAEKNPDITSVITHGLVPAAIIHDIGFPERLMALLRRPNMHAEVLFPAKWPDYPYPEGQEQLKYLRDDLGAEKLLWGSDSPHSTTAWCTYTQALNFIRVHCCFLSQQEKDLILGGNAERIFRLK